jgi:hypothetical protein
MSKQPPLGVIARRPLVRQQSDKWAPIIRSLNLSFE